MLSFLKEYFGTKDGFDLDYANNFIRDFFNRRGYRIVKIENWGPHYPVGIVLSKNGNRSIFKVPYEAFSKYNLDNSFEMLFAFGMLFERSGK